MWWNAVRMRTGSSTTVRTIHVQGRGSAVSALARISHTLSTAEPQSRAPTALRSIRMFDVLFSTPARPNLLFLWTDQHRGDAVPWADNPAIKAPNFFQPLGERSFLFHRTYVTQPVCTPSPRQAPNFRSPVARSSRSTRTFTSSPFSLRFASFVPAPRLTSRPRIESPT